MMTRWAISLLGVMAISLGGGMASAESGPVTFYEHVLPIVQEKCQNCHRPNGAITKSEARAAMEKTHNAQHASD